MMERRSFAVLAVTSGLVMGLLGTALFYGKRLGLSFPLFAALAVIMLLASARPAGRRLRLRNLWPILPLLFFAVMVAVRADELVTFLNVLAVLALGGLVIFYLPLEQNLDEDALPEQTLYVIGTGFALIPYSINEAGYSWQWLRDQRRRGGPQITAALRGLALAAPVILVFAFLLGSADAVFASYVNEAWKGIRQILGLQYFDDMIGRTLFTLVLAMLATGSIAFALKRSAHEPVRQPASSPPAVTDEADEPEHEDDEPVVAAALKAEKRKPGFKLSMIESGIVLGSIVLLFAAFVAIQFAYFFGGRANIGIEGMTFAQYARRGFFELVAVSVMTLGLALWLDRVTVRHEGRENRLFRGLALALVGLTAVMLVSASQRMLLYEEAFGFTQLRVYTHVFMHWLGVLFGVFVLALFRLRRNVFSFGSLLCIIGYLGTLNLMNVDYYIAERNISRYHQGHELDAAFLNILSADATAPILALYQETEAGTQAHTWAGQWLIRQWSALESDQARNNATIFSANAGRASAYAQLSAIQGSLPAYDPALYWQSSYEDQLYSEYDRYGSGWQAIITPETGR